MERYEQIFQISSQCIPFSFCNQIVLEKLVFAVLFVQSFQHNFDAAVFRLFHKLVHVVLRKISFRLQGIGGWYYGQAEICERQRFWLLRTTKTADGIRGLVSCLLLPDSFSIIVVYLIPFDRENGTIDNVYYRGWISTRNNEQIIRNTKRKPPATIEQCFIRTIVGCRGRRLLWAMVVFFFQCVINHVRLSAKEVTIRPRFCRFV